MLYPDKVVIDTEPLLIVLRARQKSPDGMPVHYRTPQTQTYTFIHYYTVGNYIKLILNSVRKLNYLKETQAKLYRTVILCITLYTMSIAILLFITVCHLWSSLYNGAID